MSFLLNPFRFAAAPSSFPAVESVTGQSFSSDANSFNVILPATVAGDLLWLHLAVLHSGTITGPGGSWSNLRTPSSVNIFTGLIANGTEGGTSVVINKTGTATTAAAQIIRVSNWSSVLADIESATGGGLTNTATFDPPNLAPSYGAGDTLWIAAYWAQPSVVSLTTYPDDTVNQNYQNDESAGFICEVACATRQLNAPSWDPTAFVASGNQGNAAAYTFAIKAAA